MKRRVRKIVNFFAFNLLFFALYLNFIHKDQAGGASTARGNNVVVNHTQPVANPEAYMVTSAVTAEQQINNATGNQSQGAALKLTIN